MPHPKRSASFDPAVFLLEQPFMTSYQEEIHRYRHILYRIFENIVPGDERADDEEYKRVFTNFSYWITRDVPINYGLIMHLFHVYLCYWSFCRVHYCPEKGTIFAYQCSRQPGVVEFAGIVQCAFYCASYISHWIYLPLESYVLVYGSFLMNSALCCAFWMAPSYHPGWMLSGGASTGLYRTWNAVYIPFLYWWWFLLCNRNRMGIAFWEAKKDIIDYVEGKMENAKSPSKKSAKRKTRKENDSHDSHWSLQGIKEYIVKQERVIAPIVLWSFRIWRFLSSFIFLALYRYFITRRNVYFSMLIDLAGMPGIFWTAFLCATSFISISVWYSYLTFQNYKLLWLEPYKKGVLIITFEGESSIGLVY